MDGIAGIKFLVEGDYRHTWAIIKAHFSFYFNLKHTLQKRKEIKLFPNYKPRNKQTYQSSIVFEHYLRKKKKFSDLRTELFSA